MYVFDLLWALDVRRFPLVDCPLYFLLARLESLDVRDILAAGYVCSSGQHHTLHNST